MIFFERMEPRILYSADALAGMITIDQPYTTEYAALDLTQSALYLTTEFSLESQQSDYFSLNEAAELLTLGDLSEVPHDSDRDTKPDHVTLLFDASLDELEYDFEGRQEIVFVDSATPDYDALIEDLRNELDSHYQPVILDTKADRIDQRGLTPDAASANGEGEATGNSAPVFTSNGPFPVDEGTATGIVVGDVDANDGDGGVADEGISYSLTSNVDLDSDGNPAFAIDNTTGVIVVNDADDLDFETAQQLQVTVEADDGELTSESVVTLDLIDIAPSVSASGAAEVNVGDPYALTLTVDEPGTSGITTYTVNWGDGTVTTEAYTGLTTTVTHVYTNVGFTNNITFTANDVNDTITNSDLVTTSWTNGDDVFVIDGDTGAVKGTFDSTGNELKKPYGIAVGPDGNIYVSGVISKNIVRFAPDGSYLGEFADVPELDSPSGLAWGGDGNLYVANTKDDNILRFDSSGALIDIWADDQSGELDSPEALTFGPNGDLYVSDSSDNQIVVIDGVNGGAGTALPITGLDVPEQLVFDEAGNLYFTNGSNNNVLVWDGTTTSVYLTHSELNYASGLGIGPDGKMYVTSFDDNTILRTNGVTSEVFLTSGSGVLNDPSQLAFTPDQQVTVTENTPPSAENINSTSSYNEGDVSVQITDIKVNDVDAGEIITASLTLQNTVTGELTNNNGAAYDSVSGIWTITDTVDSVNTALANLEFLPAEDNDVNTSISVAIDDGDGGGPLVGSINLDVTPSNDAPTATNLTTAALIIGGAENVPLADIVVSDADTNEQITATLTVDRQILGSLTSNDNASYNINDGRWTITGTLNEVNTALANVEYDSRLFNDFENTIDVVIDDGDEDNGGPLTGTISIVNRIPNTPPSATGLDSVSSYTEGDVSVAIDDIEVTDNDLDENVTATLTLANTNTGSLSSNDGATYDAGSGVWSITGGVAAVNTALANLTFVPLIDNEVDTSISVVIDDDDEDGSGPLTGTISLNVTPVNDTPTATNLDSISDYTEGDTSVAIDNIVVADVDLNENVSATLTLANANTGSLSSNDGATYDAGSGVWSITGGVAAVNTALANLTFVPLTDNEVDASISVVIDDDDEDGSGPLTGTISLNVTPVNDAPTATNLDSNAEYTEGDASVDIEDIVISDVDTDEDVKATLTLTDVTSGRLSDNDGASYNSATGIWEISGALEMVNTALSNLQFYPAVDNDLNTSISVEIDDGDEDGSSALSGTIALNVIAENDIAVATNLNSVSNYTEDDLTVDIDNIVVGDVDADDKIIATLVLSDTNTGALSDNDGASYDVDTGVWNFTGTVKEVNTALANVIFMPAADNDINSSISVSIRDLSTSISDALTGTVQLIVDPVNDQPTATNLESTSTYEEGELAVPIADIVVSDADAGELITANLTLLGNDTGRLSAEDGAEYDESSGIWTITDTVERVNVALGNIVFLPEPDNDKGTNIRVEIDDGENRKVEGTVSLVVLPVNDAPVVSDLEGSTDYVEGAESVPLKTFNIVDIDSDETITATLVLANVNSGSLSSNDGATYSPDTGVWTLTAPVEEVNVALTNIEFIPAPDNKEGASVSVFIDDGDEDASGPIVETIEINVTLSPDVEPPAAALPDVVTNEVTEEEPEVSEQTEESAEEQEPETDGTADEEGEEEPSEEIVEIVEQSQDVKTAFEDVVDIELEEEVSEFQIVRDDIDTASVDDKITRIAEYKPTAINILKSELTEQLNLLEDPLQYIGAESFVYRLDSLREELDSETNTSDKIIGSSMTATAGLSVGYVIWLARSGILLSSALSSLPAWRFIDPLPVLGSLHNDDSDDDESLESMVTEKEADDVVKQSRVDIDE
ncbi:MAG: LEPR-XLL domain-containing protein [Granulosicoccus sp.]